MERAIEKIVNYLKISYAPDFRMLAILRICIAFIGMVDIGIRFQDLEAHYTESGSLPINYVTIPNLFYLKAYFFNDSIIALKFLFGIHFLLYILLLIGVFPRLISIFLWVMSASLMLRNPYITQGGDELLRMILFLGIFLPWGEKYGLTSPKINKHNETSYSFINFIFLVQVGCVYFFSAILKHSVEWRTDFSAIWYALQLDEMVMPLGKVLRDHYLLCQVLTFITIGLEWVIIFFVISPFRKVRNIAAIIMIVFHLAIGMTLFVGLFYAICLSAALGCFSFKKGINITNIESQKINIFKKIYLGGEEIFLAMILFFILYTNNEKSNLIPYKLDYGISNPVEWFQIQQNWGMFAPSVYKNDGFIVGAATLKNGYIIDVIRNGKTMSFEKPINILDDIPNDRWRKFYEYYVGSDYSWMRYSYCSYLFKKWNRTHSNQQITKLRMFFVEELTLPYPQKMKLEAKELCECTE